MKLVNNLMLGCNMAAAAEALILGQRMGLSLESIRDIVLTGSGNSYVFGAKIDKFILSNNFNGGFAVQLQLKDLKLAMDAGDESGLSMPMCRSAAEIYKRSIELGSGNLDVASIVNQT